MKLLITEEEFQNRKYADLIPIECENCNKQLTRSKRQIHKNRQNGLKGTYCNIKCNKEHSGYITKEVSCKQCSISFVKNNSEIKRVVNNFCSRSCAATFNNTHKKHGTRRSKLEKWLEEQLPALYPQLEFHFNRKDAINSELDIYIPSIKLAFELNGIYHYEPIHGQDKLQQIQNNDQRKFAACHESGISLCLIDTSSFSYFKPDRAQKYLTIIADFINKSLSSISDSNG